MISVGLMDGDAHDCLGALDNLLARSRSLPSLVLARDGESDNWPPAGWAERVAEAGEARRGYAGMPRADARLLAMEEESLCNWRWCPGSLGGCCNESFVAADIELLIGFAFDGVLTSA